MTPPFHGHCLCGGTRFACRATPLWQGHCHCESCRRATGSPFTSFLGVAEGTWEWTGAPPATFDSSPGVTRFFCGTCGTPMGYRAARFPGEMHFYAATLDDPGSYAPTRHFNAGERLPWVHIADGLPE